ncbi:MAG: hypothetical protein ABFS37_15660 [Acidobacteriota bacterium]
MVRIRNAIVGADGLEAANLTDLFMASPYGNLCQSLGRPSSILFDRS